MRYIKKSKPPQSLLNHLKTPHHNYDNYAEKDDLRKSLLNEQGYLCCYCMQRIQSSTEEKMKIEHFKPQNNTNSDLDYKNLLGACKGNEGKPPRLQHCDTAKKSQEITLNPLNKVLMENIKFTLKGEIFVENYIQNEEIHKILNLNEGELMRTRMEIWAGLKKKINRKFGNAQPSASFINDEIQKWKRVESGKLESFCQVALYYLQKQLKRAV
jgi:uncharacterized protein (TIGR02646 family)